MKIDKSKPQVIIEDLRKKFLAQGEVPTGVLRSEIEESWERSIQAGVDSQADLNMHSLSKGELDDLKEKNKGLIEIAHPEVEQLADFFASEEALVLLADKDACILEAKGDKRFLEKAFKYELEVGANWGEQLKGTNAVGTALIEKRSVMVKGGEHFLDSAGTFSCCSAPIIDPHGELAGVIDLTFPADKGELPPQMSLLQQAIRSVENRMFVSEFHRQVVISIHSLPEYLRSSWQGLCAMELDGHIQGVNDLLCHIIGMKRSQLTGRNFEEVFNIGSEKLLTDLCKKKRAKIQIQRCEFVCELLHFPNLLAASNAGSNRHKRKETAKQINEPQLEQIGGEDLRLKRGIRMGRRALAHELPILIQGETGTGKEVIARTLHLNSNRREGPFVAVNCAAIPEGLIESELFGYKEGAFTGSRRGGMVGRFEQAQEGTLFLDEIGDMPLGLQARMLRVLQERTVAPLGGGEEIALDIAVICASHRNLSTMTAEGEFREDLYYRLNGVCLHIPALRDRTDKNGFIRSFLSKISPDGRELEIEEDLIEDFLVYGWPGNIRQLETVLRVAIAFMDPDEVRITRHHLSDDFQDELKQDVLNSNANVGTIEPESTGALKNSELIAVKRAMRECDGNVTAAAGVLGISRATLYRKLKQLDSD